VTGIPPRRRDSRHRIGLVLGPAVFGTVLLLPSPADLDPAGWRTAAVAGLMAVWWITEAIPIAATALLPLALFPLLGVGPIDVVATPYAHPLVFLFLGGFLLALAIERCGLHRRLALSILRAFGAGPRGIVAAFMASAALGSMWISNTATTLMLLPIGLSVLDRARGDEGTGAAVDEPHPGGNFATALMLGIAFAASIGGMATLIGTPPNALVAAYLEESHGIRIGFARWMAVGLPLVAIALPVAYGILVRAFPVAGDAIAAGRTRIEAEIAARPPMSSAERRVGWVFALTAIAWVTRPLLSAVVPGLSDAGIAILAGVALFLVPAGGGEASSLLRWRDTRGLPWGVLILFGGGLALASGIDRTGLAGWIGTGLSGLAAWPLVALLAVVALVVILFSELASNTATAAAFLPIVGAVAVGIGLDPRALVVPTALAASGGFMLPVATPPNAIVYGSGAITIPQLVRAGGFLDVAWVILVTLAGAILVPLVFPA